MQVKPDHPVNRPVLPPLMLLSLVVCVAFAAMHGTEHQSVLSDTVAVISGACFVTLFGLYWLGWLLREHELWREGRRQEME